MMLLAVSISDEEKDVILGTGANMVSGLSFKSDKKGGLPRYTCYKLSRKRRAKIH